MMDFEVEDEVRKLIHRVHEEGDVHSPELNDILDSISVIYDHKREWFIHHWEEPHGQYVMNEFLKLQDQLARKGVKRDEFADVVCTYINDTCFVML